MCVGRRVGGRWEVRQWGGKGAGLFAKGECLQKVRTWKVISGPKVKNVCLSGCY